MTAKPKRALIAYCALADRLRTPGMGIVQAMTPFLAEACQQFAGELFDASKFSVAVAQRYDIQIPKLAALGLTEQLAAEGILVPLPGHSKSVVYRYAPAPVINEATLTSPVTEAEVDTVLQSFVAYCRTDTKLDDRDASALQSDFLDRLLHVDSMRLLSRREASNAVKKTADTILLKRPVAASEQPVAAELHLDFLVSQFLLDLRDANPQTFERVSDIAFANMAAEAIACFRDPPAGNTSLIGLTVYLDSPLLLDMLGVNAEYAEYGTELLEAIRSSGATAAVFDHCVSEAEGAINARLAYLRSGVNQITSQWGTTAKPDLLAALIGNVGKRAAERLGISVQRDPEAMLHRRAQTTVGDIEAQMTSRMQAWRNVEAKEHDRKSVWAMLAIRDASLPCPRLCDSKWLLLTRNTALVNIANEAWATWLRGSTKHSITHIERWTPVAVSDKQFAGYLWTRAGGGDSAMSKARLLAHCSAAVRPRADVKARAYNLVLELSGKAEADDIAALLEDREGARALMRATKGDPEDVTPERLPFIIEQAKLAAGEYAAAAVRSESEKNLAAIRLQHEQEVERMQEEAARERLVLEAQAAATHAARAQEQFAQQQVVAHNDALKTALAQAETAEAARKARILQDGVDAGAHLYKVLRWIITIVFGLVTAAAAYSSKLMPDAVSAGLSFTLAVAGFWFVPEFLGKPLSRIAYSRYRTVVADRDPNIAIPAEPPNFRRGTGST